ncbi:MAG: PEP-CTERM sorting domain-containing protein, partial [Phenylobacterium sp.]
AVLAEDTGIAGVDIQPFSFGLPTFRNGVLTFELMTAVPEPSSWVLMIMAMGALGAALRRRRALSLA